MYTHHRLVNFYTPGINSQPKQAYCNVVCPLFGGTHSSMENKPLQYKVYYMNHFLNVYRQYLTCS